MALETGTYISDLVATNPTSSDPKSQGDDHLRLIKSVLQATLPNLSGAMTLSHTELNLLKSFSSAANGYQKFPSGIIVQWGNATPVASPGTTVTYPIAFPTAVRIVIAGNNSTGFVYTGTETTTTFKLIAPGGGGGVFWIAIGY